MLLGRYFFEADSERMEPIEWELLDAGEEANLYVSKYVIESMPYTDRYGCKWDESIIRKWLNNEFWNTAFTVDEQERIAAVRHEGENIEGMRIVIPKSHVIDHVFLLSLKEVYKYDLHYVECTPYAANKQGDSDATSWCTRTSGFTHFEGALNYYSSLCYTILPPDTMERELAVDAVGWNGVRPAIWVYKTRTGKSSIGGRYE